MQGAERWFAPALALVALVTLLRVTALAFDKTDLFVDEAQYWLWGQNLDFGYYSKPPLIAWLIRAVTDLAGSDAVFWVRLPGAFLHGATALLLAAVAARLHSPPAAFWTAASYVTLPMTALGSVMISTDTVMAPFFAAAILFYLRAATGGGTGAAVAAGLMAGLACLAKYAGLYFFLGAALGAIFVPQMRIPRQAAFAMVAAGVAVMLPNLAWNLQNGLATFEHTMDNIGWVKAGAPASGLNPAGLAEFFLAQFAVAGPILFGALLWAYLAAKAPAQRALTLMSVPPLAIVCVQALLSKAYANWAIAAYFAGTVLAVGFLQERAPRLLRASVIVNALISALVALAIVAAPRPEWKGAPALARYLGRADLSRQVIDLARAEGLGTIVAVNRDLLADLFYTGRGADLEFRAPRPAEGAANNYYEQIFPLSDDAGDVLYLGEGAPDCGQGAGSALATFDTAGGAYTERSIAAYRVAAECLNDR